MYDCLWKDEDILKCHSFDEDATEDDMKWTMAIHDKYRAFRYFAHARKEVMHTGYTVLEGFLADHLLPKRIGLGTDNYGLDDEENVESDGNVENAEDMISLKDYSVNGKVIRISLEYLQEKFPAPEELPKLVGVEQSNPFYYIINNGDEKDLENARKGSGRYSTSRSGVMETLESEEADDAWKSRALLDMRVAMSVRLMGLPGSLGDTMADRVCIPKTGGGS